MLRVHPPAKCSVCCFAGGFYPMCTHSPLNVSNKLESLSVNEWCVKVWMVGTNAWLSTLNSLIIICVYGYTVGSTNKACTEISFMVCFCRIRICHRSFGSALSSRVTLGENVCITQHYGYGPVRNEDSEGRKESIVEVYCHIFQPGSWMKSACKSNLDLVHSRQCAWGNRFCNMYDCPKLVCIFMRAM